MKSIVKKLVLTILLFPPVILFYSNADLQSTLLAASSRDGEDLVPLELVQPEDREAVQKMLEDNTFHRDIDKVKFKSNIQTYEYLLANLPFAATVARILNLENYRITQHPDGSFHGVAQNGVSGSFKLVYRGTDKRIYYGTGGYHGKRIPDISGKGLLVLEFEQRGHGKSSIMENKLHAYVKIDDNVVAFLAKVLMPLIGSYIDEELDDWIAAARKVSELVTNDARGLYDKIKDSNEISPLELTEYKETFLDEIEVYESH